MRPVALAARGRGLGRRKLLIEPARAGGFACVSGYGDRCHGWLAVLLAVALSGCAHHPQSTGLVSPPAIRAGYTETGVASWYGKPYDGRHAADGEIYHMEDMTAAHRTLPFNTWVRVRNLDNDRTVDVRIIDRGPFKDDRVIDVSRAAASKLEMIGPGTARVRLVVLRAPEIVSSGIFAVQVGAFQDRRNADRLRRRMQSRYGEARVVFRDGEPALWRVLVGAESTQDQAAELAARIRKDSDEKTTAFVVRIDAA